MEYLQTDVDPAGNPVKYDRSDAGIQAWMLFCVMVAGKGAAQTKAALTRFLSNAKTTPFAYILELESKEPGTLLNAVMDARAGQYSKLTKSFSVLAAYGTDWLRTCSVAELESVHGIGMKTSRFFVLSTRENARHAALDTHLLKELRTEDAMPFLKAYNLHETFIPTATPPKGLYLKLEQVVLDMADAKGMTPAAFDYEVWYKYYKGN